MAIDPTRELNNMRLGVDNAHMLCVSHLEKGTQSVEELKDFAESLERRLARASDAYAALLTRFSAAQVLTRYGSFLNPSPADMGAAIAAVVSARNGVRTAIGGLWNNQVYTYNATTGTFSDINVPLASRTALTAAVTTLRDALAPLAATE